MIRSLYLKILLHWIAALIVTEALIFALFMLVGGNGHRQYVVRSVGQTSVIARDFLQTAVAAQVAKGAVPDEALRSAVIRLAETSGARVWVTGTGREPIAASFPGEAPAPPEPPRRPGKYGDVTVAVFPAGGITWYAALPLTVPGAADQAMLHLLSQRAVEAFPVAPFAAGLALIGALVALLAVPLSLRITKPLNRLQQSAQRIAGGDLSARAEVSQRDEIGRLATAFNMMADTLQRMVRGGKELTANISHELRSPLTRMRVAGECLRDALGRDDKGEADEMLEAMWEDIEEADRMIARILQFSKLDLHEPLPESGEVNLAEVITGLAKTLGPEARAKNISFGLDLLAQEKVAGDEEWLRTAFKNILENAVRHTAPDGRVLVEMRREDGSLLVQVTNTHPPLRPEELQLIFDPFYRGKESRGEGTGLGLAITRKIVAIHHGQVGARNASNGFQVWVNLPRLEA